jgi:hypothetical protein
MPFITPEQRKKVNMDIPGDRCYVEYKRMIEKWRANPRWTTADELLSELIPDDNTRAKALAYAVFFCREVMVYEEKMAKKNGDV